VSTGMEHTPGRGDPGGREGLPAGKKARTKEHRSSYYEISSEADLVRRIDPAERIKSKWSVPRPVHSALLRSCSSFRLGHWRTLSELMYNTALFLV
jgi:hypothetical protein